MPQYVIEREIPGAHTLTDEELKAVSMKSLASMQALGPQIQWLHSYVTRDKIYCVERALERVTLDASNRHAERAPHRGGRAGEPQRMRGVPLHRREAREAFDRPHLAARIARGGEDAVRLLEEPACIGGPLVLARDVA